MIEDQKIYGIIAQFASDHALLEAIHRTRQAGYRKIEAYTPFPVHGLSEALELKPTRLPAIIFTGGLTGVLIGLGMQWSSAAWFFPLNVAGKPYFSWPAFVPITFECMILGAALSAVFGMLGLNGLPQPYHALFNSNAFSLASRDKFFLCVESDDARFDPAQTRVFLESLGPEWIEVVLP